MLPGFTSSSTVIVNSAVTSALAVVGPSKEHKVGSGPTVLIVSLLNLVDWVRFVVNVKFWFVAPGICAQTSIAVSVVLYHW